MQSDVVVHIVDDDAAVRHSLGLLMQSVELYSKSYASAQEFLGAFDASRPGCLVLDIRMPEMSGLDLQEELSARHIEIPVIIITGHGDVPIAVRAMKQGAMDVLEKPYNEQALLDSISKAITKSILVLKDQKARDTFTALAKSLSPRELEVMQMLIAGKCSKEMALDLSISSKTVDVHRAHIMEKMRVKSVIELVCLAIANKSPEAIR